MRRDDIDEGRVYVLRGDDGDYYAKRLVWQPAAPVAWPRPTRQTGTVFAPVDDGRRTIPACLAVAGQRVLHPAPPHDPEGT